MKHKLLIPVLILSGLAGFNAQKKPLDHSVYDAWQSIGNREITANGKWIAYQVNPQEGDAHLYLKNNRNTSSLVFPRGGNFDFTNDSRFIILQIKPFYKDIKAVKDKKLKKEKLVKDSLAIVNLETLNTEKLANIQSFKTPKKGGSWLAYLLANPNEKTEDKKDNDDKEASSKPSILVVYNLITGKKDQYENVVQYHFSENGKSLAFITQKPEDKKENKTKEKENKDKSTPKKYALQSVNWLDLSNGKLRKLTEAEASYSQLSWDELGKQLAFVGTLSAESDLVKNYQLYYYTPEKEFQIGKDKKLPHQWVISENRQPSFSKNGQQLYFGLAPQPIAKDTTLIANDHAVVDIWNYKDDYLQTVQLKNVKKDLQKSYLSVLQTNTPEKLQTLGSEKLDSVKTMDNGNSHWVLASSSSLEAKIATQWAGSTDKDYYLINTLTGEKQAIFSNFDGRVEISPLGNFLVYFNRKNGNWYSYHIKTQKHSQLNQNLNINFTDELWDMPDLPRPYGIAAWTDKDESVIIRDRYDLWEFFLNSSKKPINITQSYGRKNKITFDTFIFDPEDKKSLNRKAKVLLSAFNENTKDEGLFLTQISTAKAPKEIFMENISGIRSLKKAKDAEEYIYTKENYIHSPNLYVSSDFKNQIQLSSTNPQQAQYNWGTDELVHWTTPKGYHSTGILYKPEDFDPNKKYPMIVYFYEKLSDGLNKYVAPAPTPSRLNISYFVSNGYLVFTPDISYENGHPGKSAVEFINSGVESLKKHPWVDAQHIGIQGQSWGGYQVAHLITVNNMYAAAWSGAPVVNMTSAYGGIRWESGMNRQFQYEKTQSRIGKTLWEAPDLYIENSPLFHFTNVNTPVVIMANDQDGAVPWYQGIEMFTALRRLGKPVWMLNYNGDVHNLMKRQNRKDIQIREQQFFDHYLKGAKAPAWMTKGIPATMKGKTWGFELTDEQP